VGRRWAAGWQREVGDLDRRTDGSGRRRENRRMAAWRGAGGVGRRVHGTSCQRFNLSVSKSAW